MTVQFKLASNRVMVEISEQDRDAVFRKAITTVTGQQLFITKDLPARRIQDKFFSQTVNIGKVVQVSDDVEHIRVGDQLMFDVTVDSNLNNKFEETEQYKRVIIQAKDSYHTEDYFAPPNGKKKGSWVWRKGEVNEMSHIICIIRDGEFISVNNIVLTDAIIPSRILTKEGISVTPKPELVDKKKVLIAPEGSGLKPGDSLIVNADYVSVFDLAGRLFNYFYLEDIFLKIEL